MMAMLLAPGDGFDETRVMVNTQCEIRVRDYRAVRLREASTIEERKKTLTSVLVDVATVGAEHMERKLGRGSLRDVTVATGVSVDKACPPKRNAPSAA